MRFVIALLVLLLATLPAPAAQVTVIGKLVDRQCSVEDVFQRQPTEEKWCILTFEETRTVGGVTTVQRFTVYCPNKVIHGAFRGAYEVCSDPAALQIRNTTNYAVTGELRTVAEQEDGKGQILANSLQF